MIDFSNVDHVKDVIATLPKQDTSEFIAAKRADSQSDIRLSLMISGAKVQRPVRGKSQTLVNFKFITYFRCSLRAPRSVLCSKVRC